MRANRPPLLRSVVAGVLLAATAVRAQQSPPATAPPADQPAAQPAAAAAAETDESVVLSERLLDRQPFDRLTLKGEGGGESVLETVLLELPERKVPTPLPTTGALELRRLSHPSIPYSAQWSSIAKVELFEHMLLAEAARLAAAGEFAEAFDYLASLSTNYPQLEGLEAARQEHLWREASAAYAAGKRDEAWPVLLALYERNPDFPRLATAVQAVGDDLIARHLAAKNYAAARAVLDTIEQGFSKLALANVAKWRQQFITDANAELAKARTALDAEDYSAARNSTNHARAIQPTIEGGDELWRQIQAKSPEMRVGVTQAGLPSSPAHTPDWAAARVNDLVAPRLVDMVGFGAEGGVYACPWGEVQTNDAGVETTLTLSPQALRRGLRPDAIALCLIDMATPGNPKYQEGLAGVLTGVQSAAGRDVKVAWQRPHIRPETFLQAPLPWLTHADRAPALWFEAPKLADGGKELRYTRTGPPTAAPGEPRYVVELIYEDDGAAVAALLNGDVDAIDRVPPWQLASVRQAANIVVEPYRLPTVHVLAPNLENPLLQVREFRRALAYAIDGESIVRDILLAGQNQPGFRTLSGPFPAGVSLSDPAGYGYNAEIQPRPYEPRLAALLAGVARTTLAKREAALVKEREAAKKTAEREAAANAGKELPAEKVAETPATTDAETPPAEPVLPPMTPLVLAHPADPLARLACQTIKLQLDGVGIPIKLVELSPGQPPSATKYDLLYLELAAWEPICDARRLLGPGGVAGQSSALMSLALDELDRAENWNQARAQLKEIHRIAFYDLPLVPLWQTANHFAYRNNLQGVGTTPVKLYQNISAWRKSAE